MLVLTNFSIGIFIRFVSETYSDMTTGHILYIHNLPTWINSRLLARSKIHGKIRHYHRD